LKICICNFLNRAIADVHHGDVGGRVAAVFLSPHRGQVAIERDHRSVLIHHAGARDAHAKRLGDGAVDRLDVERRTPRIRSARARDDDTFAIRRPVECLIVAGEPCELLWLTAGGRHDEHVVVARAVARERNPLSVGREARRKIASDVHRESPGIRAIGIDEPDVVLIGERHAAVVRDTGVAREANLFGFLRAEYAAERGDGERDGCAAAEHGDER